MSFNRLLNGLVDGSLQLSECESQVDSVANVLCFPREFLLLGRYNSPGHRYNISWYLDKYKTNFKRFVPKPQYSFSLIHGKSDKKK